MSLGYACWHGRVSGWKERDCGRSSDDTDVEDEVTRHDEIAHEKQARDPVIALSRNEEQGGGGGNPQPITKLACVHACFRSLHQRRASAPALDWPSYENGIP